ncbi:MAG: ASCH domain-containing protein [candidate division Zixibacteria bacterium]|nr:ASCH domain-containing protein [candidate division Zixibacteria bacterium]
MKRSPETEKYWQDFIRSLADKESVPSSYAVYYFGNRKQLADELAELVRTGIKTATSTLFWEFEHDCEPMPRVGDFTVVTNWEGEPRCIIEIMEVEMKKFSETDEQFAYDYGEGERTLAWWKEDMSQYYTKLCEKIGKTFSENITLVCERFRVLYAA